MFKIILKNAFYTPPKYNIKFNNDTDIKMQNIQKYYLELNKQYYNNMTNKLKQNYKKNIVNNNNIHLL